ncbi:Glia maturation factor gamma [Mizuhopecten yessoensis]|uniref:Glia maturation factor gamma n=1 Tax=Mizuhopecten yessoensis TaxID=6573 RepID=A0A210QNR0_MIZYE|nr:Glia maturation factor gamma [Mizuhopecten yessoensis]
MAPSRIIPATGQDLDKYWQLDVQSAAAANFSAIPDGLKSQIKKFRFRKEKTIAARILKINAETDEVEMETELEDCSLEEIQEEICEHQPRYIIISYKYAHDDGRLSYPFFFVFYSPRGCNIEQRMRYAGTKGKLQEELGVTKG